jgi:hypothetical protein
VKVNKETKKYGSVIGDFSQPDSSVLGRDATTH